MGNNELGHKRGLHIVVLSPLNFEIKFAKVFDTYKSSVAFDKFIEEDMKGLFGHIVIAACKDECV